MIVSAPNQPTATSESAISPRAWLWAAILEAIGFATSFIVGLLVLDSLALALGGCGLVSVLFTLWVFIAGRRARERAPSTDDLGSISSG